MPRAPRFIVPLPGARAPGVAVDLPPAVAHQATRVLRLRPGDPIELFDGSGGAWRATLDRVATHGSATATLVAFEPPGDADRARHVTLVIGLLKGEKLEWVVQKATEVGVARIAPVVTARSVAVTGRADRWRRIAAEATEQCGRTIVPVIDDPVPLGESLRLGAADAIRVACWEDESVVPFRDVVSCSAPDAPVVVWVGPEGGFSRDEASLLTLARATTASLGPRILRSETAAVVAVALAIEPGLSSTRH